MSEPNLWLSLKTSLLSKTTLLKIPENINSNLEELFKEVSTESYVIELKKAIMIMGRHCPVEITTPFKGNCLEVTSDGKNFVFGSIEGRIAVVDKDTKEIIHDVLLEGGSIYAIALYQNDAYVIAGGKDGIIKKFDFKTFEEVRTYTGHEKEINGLVISKNEDFIYSASDDCTVRAWNENEEGSTILYTHDKAVLCLGRSADGNFLISGGSDKTVKIFSLEFGKITQQLTEFNSSVWAVKISDNNKYFAAGDSNAIIKVWEFESSKLLKALTGHTKRVSHLEFASNENFILSSSNDCTLRIWDLLEEKNELILTGHTDWIKSFKLSSDEKSIYSIAENFKIMTWRFPRFDSSSKKKRHNIPILFLCYSRVNNLIFTSDGKEIKVWDMFSKEVIKTLKNPFKVTAMCITSDFTTLFAAYSNNKVMDWNLEDDTSQVKITHSSVIRTMVMSPDGRFLVCGDSNFRVTVYNKKNFERLNIFRRHNSLITALAFSKPVMSENDQFFSGGGDHMIFMYSINDNKSFKLSGHKSEVTSFGVSRNNELLISGEESGEFKIWHILKQTCIKTVNTHSGKITGIYFSENSKYFWISSCDCSLSLWNSINFAEVTSLKTKHPIANMVVTKNEEEIVLTENEDVHFMANPLKAKQFFIYGPGREYYSFMKYLLDICEGNEQPHNPEMDKWMIIPFEINALHFYAYFNLPLHLKGALMSNSPFYFSRSGYSPIQIAIHRNFRDCIHVTLKSMRLKVEENPYSIGYLEDSIIKLNELGFRGLDEFYRAIFFRTRDKLLPKFVDESVSLPIIFHSKSLGPQQKDFFNANDANNFGVPIVFWQSALKIDVVIGSSTSIAFLESILDCPNSEIFRTAFIKELILHKWKYIKWFLMPQAILYLVYMLLLSYYMIVLEGSEIVTSDLIFFLNVLLTGYELFQLCLTGSMYFGDLWNYIDILRFSLCFVYSALFWAEYDDKMTKQILVSVAFLSMLRGISYFRLFDNTRYMINLLSEVFRDMTSFLILLAYSTYSFALIYFIMVNNVIDSSGDSGEAPDKKPFSEYIATSYLLNLGEFDTDDYGAFEWCIFFFASVINPLIMLNLLISIMGDTYSRVKEEQEIADMKELAGMVIEGEYILFCKRNRGRKNYMQICKEEEVTTSIDSVDLKIDKIKIRLRKLELNIEKKHEELRTEIKDTMGGVNSKLDEMTTLIEQISLTQD